MLGKKLYIFRIFCISLTIIACIIGSCLSMPSRASAGSFEGDAVEVISVPAIMYHAVLKNSGGRYAVTPARLEADFKYLKDNGYTGIFISDLIAYQEKGVRLPDKPIMITFDDGSKTNYIHAFPLMKKYGMKCIFSVVGMYTDSNYDKNGERIANAYAYLDYGHVKEMHESGLAEFQNHGYNMHILGARRGMNKKSGENVEAYKEKLAADLARNQNAIKEKTGITCTAVAFPFGAYCSATIDVVRQMGFKAAFTCTEGTNFVTRSSDLFRLCRYNRTPRLSTSDFFAKIQKLAP